MSAPRAGMAVAVLGERIFVLGGVDQFGNVLDTALQYNTQDDRWDPLLRMREERVFAAAVTFEGRVFVMGGLDGDGNVLDDVEFYDPAQNRWQPFESMEGERQGLVAVLRGANLLVAGGSNQGDQILESIERYDNAQGLWNQFFGLADDGMTSQLGEPRAAVTVGQDVYFMGGFNRGPTNLVERLGADDRFEALVPLPSARGSLATAALDDSIYVMGGRDGSDRVLDDVQRLDLASGSWTPMPRLLVRRESCGAAAVNGVLYVIGGRDDTGRVLDSVEALGEELIATAASPPTSCASRPKIPIWRPGLRRRPWIATTPSTGGISCAMPCSWSPPASGSSATSTPCSSTTGLANAASCSSLPPSPIDRCTSLCGYSTSGLLKLNPSKR